MEGGMNCIKYLMFFFNFLIFLAGAILLGVGIWVAVSANSFKQIVSSNPAIFNSVYVIIAVGAAVFLIGFLGCCGAMNENKCLLGTFFTLVLILFLVEIAGGVLVVVYGGQVESAAAVTFNGTQDDKETREAWDLVQQTFKCCGMNGSSDWKPNPPPQSCYTGANKSSGTLFPTGCQDTLAKMLLIIAGCALGVLIVELLAMIFSCCLYCSIDGGAEAYA